VALVHHPIRAEHKLEIAYADAAGVATDRTIWPLALAFFDHVRVIVAWCELRADFRNFRADRIMWLTAISARYPRRPQSLLSG
jgi:predicted DNA-binding transcriptional regulator YafY